MKKYLTLETGQVFVGTACGDTIAERWGELVFTTNMTGYQETLTDPSYTNQLVMFTYPLIGNYGVQSNTSQSESVKASAMIVQELAPSISDEPSLDHLLKMNHTPAISEIDTRQLTKIIRQEGTIHASLTNQPVKDFNTSFQNQTILHDLEIKPLESHPNKNLHVVLLDFGVKHGIIESLETLGVTVSVVSPSTTLTAIEALHPDGVLLSNGPGNPTEYANSLPLIKQLADKYPLLGICLGHQLLALAEGATTYKLPFGHRGSNHPVKNLIDGSFQMTTQNHGFAVSAASIADTPLEVTASELNDQSCEALRLPGKPVFSVQYHPEAAPSPHDAKNVFTKFTSLMNGGH